jgi:tetratricopeptide (TPR) repeat protein
VIELARPEDLIYQAIGYCYEKIRNFAQARFYYRKASHLNPDNARLYIKVAATYMKENKYLQAVKYLDMALRIKRLDPEFNLIMGECNMKLGKYKDAVHYFLTVVQSKPRNLKGWEALIRSLFEAGQFSEAEKQIQQARLRIGDKPVLDYYESAVLLAEGKTNLGFALLEKTIEAFPKQLKLFLKLYPSAVKYSQVVELLLKSKRRKHL